MSSREAILGRIREALSDVPHMPPAYDVTVDWEYGLRPASAAEDTLGLFVERVEDYRAEVSWVVPDEVPVRIANAPFSNDGDAMQVTASFGVAEFGPESEINQVLKVADELAYAAKKNGRNRVETEGGRCCGEDAG